MIGVGARKTLSPSRNYNTILFEQMSIKAYGLLPRVRPESFGCPKTMVAGLVVHRDSESRKELRQTRCGGLIGSQLVGCLDGLPNKGIDGNAGLCGEFEQEGVILFRQPYRECFSACFWNLFTHWLMMLEFHETLSWTWCLVLHLLNCAAPWSETVTSSWSFVTFLCNWRGSVPHGCKDRIKLLLIFKSETLSSSPCM